MAEDLGHRVAILAVLSMLFFLVYGFSRHYSPALVAYVVEQTLVQKAPEGMTPKTVQERFYRLMNSTRPTDKIPKLLYLSNYLEKIQKLTPAEYEELLGSADATGK